MSPPTSPQPHFLPLQQLQTLPRGGTGGPRSGASRGSAWHPLPGGDRGSGRAQVRRLNCCAGAVPGEPGGIRALLMQPGTGPCADTAGISAGTAGAASAPGGTGCATLPASCPLLGFQPLGLTKAGHQNSCFLPRTPLFPPWKALVPCLSFPKLAIPDPPSHPGHGTPRLQRCCPPLLAHPQRGRTPTSLFF